MASYAASARAASKAVPVITKNMHKLQQRQASLIFDMHSKLFPEQVENAALQRMIAETTQKYSDIKLRKEKLAEIATPEFKERPQFMERKTALAKLQMQEAEEKSKVAKHVSRKLIVHGPKTPIKKTCPDPVSLIQQKQIALLDPTGARTRLFAKTNPECARVGDILLVRQRTGEPFAGVCINIRRRGVDTGILLRGQLTRVGVEMWFKVYSPLVEGIEVVQRAAKRARRARLTYMRKPKHDRGSVENVVRVYMRQKAALGTSDGKKKGAAMAAAGGKKAKGRGKKR